MSPASSRTLPPRLLLIQPSARSRSVIQVSAEYTVPYSAVADSARASGGECSGDWVRAPRPGAGLETEQGCDEERVIIKLDDPRLAVVAQPGDAQPGLFDRWPVSRVQPVVAEEVLDDALSPI